MKKMGSLMTVRSTCKEITRRVKSLFQLGRLNGELLLETLKLRLKNIYSWLTRSTTSARPGNTRPMGNRPTTNAGTGNTRPIKLVGQFCYKGKNYIIVYQKKNDAV